MKHDYYFLKFGIESLIKSANIGASVFIIILHLYGAIRLTLVGIIHEIILPTLIFDGLLFSGLILFWMFTSKGQLGVVLKWITFVVTTIVNIFFFLWQIEEFDIFDSQFSFFFFNSILLSLWTVLIICSTFFLIVFAIFKIAKFLLQKIPIREVWQKAKIQDKLKKVLIPMVLLMVALPVANLYVNEGTVKRMITLEDSNLNCTLSIWDFPQISAQIPNTDEIDLGTLTADEMRVLTALGKMNTTFYAQSSINNDVQQNITIARCKMLQAFNLSIVWTIWYEGIGGFPGPANAENWIGQARRVLEFCITKNLTNVIGICSDSEAKANCTAKQYWEYIGIYDAFLKEVQTNSSLRHPDSFRGTFETILTFDPRALEDSIDGDFDIIYNRRMLGLPPTSWTKYHFMLYRLDGSDNTAYLHNYNILMKEFLGTANAAPIVGLTGVEWFAEGYYEGTYDVLNKHIQNYDYDGIDGWNAMKREIFYCKAMGFHTVSVFHLNKYEPPGKIENYGLLDYYGIARIEELANEWNLPKTIEYPISAMELEPRRGGFFYPNGDYIYDLQVNDEMLVIQTGILAITVGWIIIRLSIAKKKIYNGKKRSNFL